jgi:hypothetical protein
MATARERRRANDTLNRAVEAGRVTRSVWCEACGVYSPKIHGHHRDYAKPLEVVWLCSSCHKFEHGVETVHPVLHV